MFSWILKGLELQSLKGPQRALIQSLHLTRGKLSPREREGLINVTQQGPGKQGGASLWAVALLAE
jgi:hypothetical protein